MDSLKVTWRQTGETRWTGRNSGGYSFRVAEGPRGWRWSLHPPGAGYAVYKGNAPSREEAISAVEAAYRQLYDQISAALEESIRRRRKK